MTFQFLGPDPIEKQVTRTLERSAFRARHLGTSFHQYGVFPISCRQSALQLSATSALSGLRVDGDNTVGLG